MKKPPKVRERPVRMVPQHRAEYPSRWAAIESIAEKIGCIPQTLHTWVRQHEVDADQRDGVSNADAQRIRDLERENRELRKANEILQVYGADQVWRQPNREGITVARCTVERLVRRPAPIPQARTSAGQRR